MYHQSVTVHVIGNQHLMPTCCAAVLSCFVDTPHSLVATCVNS